MLPLYLETLESLKEHKNDTSFPKDHNNEDEREYSFNNYSFDQDNEQGGVTVRSWSQ